MEKLQFYIPNLFELVDSPSKRNAEDIRVIGVKKKNIKYFSGQHEKKTAHIDQIVAEGFSVYDLQLDFDTNLLSFYLEHGEVNQTKVLEEVFQTFIVEYDPQSFGYFTIAKGKRRPNTPVK